MIAITCTVNAIAITFANVVVVVRSVYCFIFVVVADVFGVRALTLRSDP